MDSKLAKFRFRRNFIKMLVIMKLTAIFLFLFTIQLAAEDGYSQNVSLEVKNSSLKKVFKEIKKQTGYYFLYSVELLMKEGKITLAVKDATLEDAINKCLENSSLTFSIVEKTVIIKKKIKVAGLPVNISEPLPPFVVKGKVADEEGNPLQNVSVIIKTTKQGISTAIDGTFSIEVPENGGTLIFSYVGFENTEMKVSEETVLNIKLKRKDYKGEEIVVVGYGGVRKSDLTGSVSSVKSKDLTAYPASNAVQALQGRAAGVLIQSNNGNPGGSFKIRIRGGNSINASSDPIFVVDGFVGANLPPPEDIESMEILKDASATSIYGSRGANGVILVTTKKGKAGKPKFEVNTSYSTQKEINRLPLLNGAQFTDYIKEINPAYSAGNANTDWQNLIFTQGNIKNTQLSFSGGTDAIHYYVSSSLYDQQGIISNSAFKRFNVTSNIDFAITKGIKVGMNILVGTSKNNGVRTQEETGGGNSTGVVAGAFKFGPDQPVLRPDGTYSLAVVGDPHDNPIGVLNELQNEVNSNNFQYNFYADINLVKNLKFKTSFGEFTNNQRSGDFIPTTLNAGRNVGGQGTLSQQLRKSYINENYLTYTSTFSKNHKITAMGGFSYQKFVSEDFFVRSQSFLSNSVSFWNLGGGAISLPGSSAFSESQLASAYARINYNLKDKYLLQLNARYDGSSNFSKNNKWAFFPTAALAWNMHKEKFMQKIKAISNFKWRLSYGLTGNQAINPFQTLARFSPVYTFVNGTSVNAVRPTTIANDELKWETTTQQNAGVEIGLFKNRITITADYYRSVTSDLLFNAPLPQYSGYTTQIKNIGKIENKGFEFAINSKNLTGDFGWNTDFNISFNRNKVLELPGGADIIYALAPGHMVGIGGSAQILRVGQPVGSFFGWIYDGVYQAGGPFIPGGGFEQAAGGESFRDISGKKDPSGAQLFQPDGILNNDDRTIIGDPNPDFIWGFNNEFTYRNFDLNCFIQGSQGNDVLSYTLLELETLSGINNTTTEGLNRWTTTNTNTNIPRAFAGRPQRVSSRFIFNGSYVRFKNLALGYTLPTEMLTRIKLQKVRLYVSAQNIFTITQYRGYDPEVNYRNSNLNAGADYASYPNARSFTAGINIIF